MSDQLRPEEGILDEALDLPPGERGAFLDKACGNDVPLRQLVQGLLQAHLQATAPRSSHQATTGPNPQPPSAHASEPETGPEQIGPYHILQKIGEGGCGTVYMAEQREPVRRRVALKVIKLGMDTKQVIARFEAERQALALMDHPNIAKVLEGAATESGRPYFVMELVRGIPITRYCDENELDTQQRLDLFIQVCHAVQHAHQKGVIHRDLKPSNILVADHDGVPVPKIIDFGIAKATAGQTLTNKTLFTALEQFIGTPAYMSPEQAKLSGLDIDTRTDVYSLGVLLYELLTGKVPFEPEDFDSAGLDEMRRIIREKDPVRPSTRLNNLGRAEQTALARRRRSEPPKLIRLMRGDLDWIVMKCLEKDRARRYETANGLAMDIQRQLANEPIVARPPSKLYRLQKLVRRHKLAFAAAGAVLAALLAGLGLSTLMFVKERAARHETMKEADKRRSEFEFLKEMLGAARPAVAKGRDPAVLKEILDQTAQRLSKDLAYEPEVAAELLLVIARTYEEIGQYTNALAGAREALRRFQSRAGSENVDVADALSLAGAICYDLGDLAEAERFGREALAMRRKLLGNRDPRVATSLNNLGNLLFLRRDLAGAEAMHREALDIRLRALGTNHLDVAKSYNNLANVAAFRGDLAAAEASYRHALAILQSAYGREDLNVATLLNNLGSLRATRGDLPGSAVLLREALAIRRKLLGAHADVAVSLTGLGITLAGLGELDPAEKMLREALTMEKTLLAPDHRYVADSLQGLGAILGKKGNLAGAEAVLQEALAMRQRLFGPDNLDVADSLGDLGLVTALRGNLAAAQTNLRKAVDLRRKLQAEPNPELAGPLWQLAWVLRQEGDPTAAEPLLREASSIIQRQEQKAAPLLLENIFVLTELLQAQGRAAEAEPLALEAARRSTTATSMDPLRQRRTLEQLVRFYEAADRAAPQASKPARAAEWKKRLADLDQKVIPE